jgi:hypothetical protein
MAGRGGRTRYSPACPLLTCVQKESPEKKKARLEMEALAAKEAEQARLELARVK